MLPTKYSSAPTTARIQLPKAMHVQHRGGRLFRSCSSRAGRSSHCGLRTRELLLRWLSNPSGQHSVTGPSNWQLDLSCRHGHSVRPVHDTYSSATPAETTARELLVTLVVGRGSEDIVLSEITGLQHARRHRTAIQQQDANQMPSFRRDRTLLLHTPAIETLVLERLDRDAERARRHAPSAQVAQYLQARTSATQLSLQITVVLSSQSNKTLAFSPSRELGPRQRC